MRLETIVIPVSSTMLFYTEYVVVLADLAVSAIRAQHQLAIFGDYLCMALADARSEAISRLMTTLYNKQTLP